MPIDSVADHYDARYHRDHRKAHEGMRAVRFCRQIIAACGHPASVIDLGCSSAAHLEPFFSDGIEVHGVDGDPAAFADDIRCIPRDCLEVHDLRVPYYPRKKYALCICTEVLEHIEEEYIDVAIDSVCRCSDTLFMTIAKPGQGGRHHRIMKPIEEWQEDFEERGFTRFTPPEEMPGLLTMRR